MTWFTAFLPFFPPFFFLVSNHNKYYSILYSLQIILVALEGFSKRWGFFSLTSALKGSRDCYVIPHALIKTLKPKLNYLSGRYFNKLLMFCLAAFVLWTYTVLCKDVVVMCLGTEKWKPSL